jgi:deoxycytidine triphosphate deaminase
MSLGKTVEKTRREKEQDRLRALVAKRPTDDRDFPFTGVLLNDAIQKCVDAFGLITPLSKENLKPANYKLRIGDEYALKGEIKTLSDQPGQNQITIDPFDVAVIKTLETINMPRFLIARWNIRVQLAYEGLLWVGGPQVDAGYVGYLFCPIYNLSDKPVTLTHGDPIAVIDFVKTSPFNPDVSMDYPHVLPERILFEDYNPQKLRSALATRVVSQLNEFDENIKNLSKVVEERMASAQGRIDNFVSITFAVVGLLFAAVTLFFGKPNVSNWWDPSVFWICALSIIVSMFAWVNSQSSVRWFRHRWQRVAFELLLIGATLCVIVGTSIHSQTRLHELDEKIQKLQHKLDQLSPNSPKQPSAPPEVEK